jgi:hypothetical protein
MHTEPIAEIERLPMNTLAAHNHYETTVLGGDYDEAWSGWYAAYILDHGLPDVLPHAANLDVTRLGAILAQRDRVESRMNDRPNTEWKRQ